MCGRYSCLKFWRMLEHPLCGNSFFLIVAKEFIFPLLLREFFTLCFIAWKIYYFPSIYVTGFPVWWCEGCWSIQPVWEFIFPVCSLRIYFSSALVRLCCLPDPLLHVSDKCNTSTAEAVIEDYVRYSCMHISVMSLVILPATSSSWISVRDDLRKCI